MNSSARPIRTLGILIALSTSLLFASSAQAAYSGQNGDLAVARYFDHGVHIFSGDPDSGKFKQLSTNKLAFGADSVAVGHPSYGPTGKRIVFTAAVQTKAIGGRRNDVFVMHADGSHVKRVTKTEDGEYEPTFTADGKQIAYSLKGKTYLVKTNGKGPRTELTSELPHGGTDATFSADGEKVAVASGDGDIFVMDADGSHPVNVTATADVAEFDPDFAPDGSRIAFISTRDDSYGDLFTMAADGSDVTVIAAGDGLEAEDPVYSPDGKRIAYATRLTKNAGIAVATIDADGGTPEAVSGLGSVSLAPSWGVK